MILYTNQRIYLQEFGTVFRRRVEHRRGGVPDGYFHPGVALFVDAFSVIWLGGLPSGWTMTIILY